MLIQILCANDIISLFLSFLDCKMGGGNNQIYLIGLWRLDKIMHIKGLVQFGATGHWLPSPPSSLLLLSCLVPLSLLLITMWNLIFSTSSVMPRYVLIYFSCHCAGQIILFPALLNKHQIGFFDPLSHPTFLSHILLRIAAQSWGCCSSAPWGFDLLCAPNLPLQPKSYYFPPCIPVSS